MRQAWRLPIFSINEGTTLLCFERQPVLGGNIRTLNKNVMPNRAECSEVLESGALEFPTVFHNFVALMEELEVKLLPVRVGSELFTPAGDRFLSRAAVRNNFTGLQRLKEDLRFDAVNIRSCGAMAKNQICKHERLLRSAAILLSHR